MTPIQRLRQGEILILPTDSIVGLHALATHPEASRRLREQKGAPSGRPFLLLVGEVAVALTIGRPLEQHRLLLERAWPGPYTFLLQPGASCAPDWIGPEGRVALRVPDHAGLRALLRELAAPLYSTSANRSGEEPAHDLEAALRRFPDLVAVDLGDPTSQLASTLVDLGDLQPRLLRLGAGPWPLSPA